MDKGKCVRPFFEDGPSILENCEIRKNPRRQVREFCALPLRRRKQMNAGNVHILTGTAGWDGECFLHMLFEPSGFVCLFHGNGMLAGNGNLIRFPAE